jgi:hypothetical protein
MLITSSALVLSAPLASETENSLHLTQDLEQDENHVVQKRSVVNSVFPLDVETNLVKEEVLSEIKGRVPFTFNCLQSRVLQPPGLSVWILLLVLKIY